MVGVLRYEGRWKREMCGKGGWGQILDTPHLSLRNFNLWGSGQWGHTEDSCRGVTRYMYRKFSCIVRGMGCIAALESQYGSIYRISLLLLGV